MSGEKVVSLFEAMQARGDFDFSVDFIGDQFWIQSDRFNDEKVDAVVVQQIIEDLRQAADILESGDDFKTQLVQ